MRILLLTHSFNSLTQRLYVELAARGHELSVEFDIADAVAEEAVALFRPELIVAPYLRRAIPAAIWTRHVCLVVHPGVIGDRGPSSLDRAILDGESNWGVTVLQANGEMDGGDIWTSEEFPMRTATKSSLYRREVTEAALHAVLLAVERYATGAFRPRPLAAHAEARSDGVRPLLRQEERTIDWRHDDTATVLRKIAAADGAPGVRDELFGSSCWLFDAHGAARCGEPGALVAIDRTRQALLRATCDGGVWIGQVRRADWLHPFKLPAAQAYAAEATRLPEQAMSETEIRYAESADGAVGYLHFDFYNGAMSTAQCARLLAAYAEALRRPTRVLVLCGGSEFWSNGIHLNCIEAADSPADESWRNINAMNDVARAILETDDRLTVAALRGNAGAGGVFLALACDQVWARAGVILNPHYRNMGNLHGSEYWTYTLPRRVGVARAQQIVANRLPVGAGEAQRNGLIDACFAGTHEEFGAEVERRAAALADADDYADVLAAKRVRRRRDEREKPLAVYRAEELAEMQRNFYGFDPSYHVARYHFVYKLPHAWTPRHLARHRRT